MSTATSDLDRALSGRAQLIPADLVSISNRLWLVENAETAQRVWMTGDRLVRDLTDIMESGKRVYADENRNGVPYLRTMPVSELFDDRPDRGMYPLLGGLVIVHRYKDGSVSIDRLNISTPAPCGELPLGW